MLPRLLSPGETLQLEQFTLSAFHKIPDAIVVVDSDGREHKMPEELIQQQFEYIQSKRTKLETEERRTRDNSTQAAFAPRT
jgi:hypothetical protein